MGQQGGGYLALACHGFALATDFKFDLASLSSDRGRDRVPKKGQTRVLRVSGHRREMQPLPMTSQPTRLTALDKALAVCPLTNENAPISKSIAPAHSWP